LILEEIIEVKIINHNLEHYKKNGYDVKYGDIIQVKSKELSPGSHYKVNCVCDNCGKIKKMNYEYYYQITNSIKNKYYCSKCVKELKTKYTNIEKYGCSNVSSSFSIKEKRKKTNVDKWGVENVFQNQEVKNKIKKTDYEKYGDYFTKTEEYRKKSEITRKLKNSKIFENEIINFKRYKKLVMSYTRSNKKELFKNWNGFDYYDKDYIKENFILNPSKDSKYPTIDHKISIFKGFKDNISPEIIGGLDNLCITKRNNNSSKHKHLKTPKIINEN